MSDLPAKLHLKIYSIACRDDGTTGSSLSLVSKRIRQLSAQHRYQSIAVCGPVQIQRFIESLGPSTLSKPTRSFPSFSPSLVQEVIQHIKVDSVENPWDTMAGDSVTNLASNIIEILSLAQGTVELLSLVSFNDEFDGSPLLHGSFPALTRLTVRGPHELPHDPALAPPSNAARQ
ncbi:hypothetical protein B0H13DRAFT_1866982 [Mycena leptocephala]|nr:hypothetical protein B0H13DRAFT_1866982 [Mycena leptocephala]